MVGTGVVVVEGGGVVGAVVGAGGVVGSVVGAGGVVGASVAVSWKINHSKCWFIKLYFGILEYLTSSELEELLLEEELEEE